uniref:Putative secreted protein n=1 Tax=Anopheles darlingi TaxID=43151 RepID=A0A2M4DCP5_ANODA
MSFRMLFSLLESLVEAISTSPADNLASFFGRSAATEPLLDAELDVDEDDAEELAVDELLTLSMLRLVGAGSELPATSSPEPSATPELGTPCLFVAISSFGNGSSSFSQNPSLLTLERLPVSPGAAETASPAPEVPAPGPVAPIPMPMAACCSRSGTLSLLLLLLLLLLDEPKVPRSRCPRRG